MTNFNTYILTWLLSSIFFYIALYILTVISFDSFMLWEIDKILIWILFILALLTPLFSIWPTYKFIKKQLYKRAVFTLLGPSIFIGTILLTYETLEILKYGEGVLFNSLMHGNIYGED